MEKADVLNTLEKYKGRMIQIGLSDDGNMMFSGLDGHWLFTDDTCIIEVKKNTSNGHYGFGEVMQQLNPFIITRANFADIVYIKTYMGKESGEISDFISSLTPVDDRDINDVIKELESDSIRKANSPMGFSNNEENKSYGIFKGSVISTEVGGIPPYLDPTVK